MSNLIANVNGGLLRATSFADTITGSAANDVLWGLGGNDVINGGDGNDIIEGDGVYTVFDQISATGSATIAFNGTSNSTNPALTSMGVLVGGNTVWRLRNTTDQAQVVTFQSATNGPNSYGPISITLEPHSYTFVTSPNTSTHKLFLGNKLVDTKGAGQQIFSYNDAYGTHTEGNDTLNGGNGNDTIRGYGGDDMLTGGAGADNLDGGTGVDTADYSASGAAVNVNLATGVGSGGDAEGDVLVNIENIIGSAFNDVLTGNGSTNMIDGGDGDDTITGGSNDDKLYGGAGDDLFLVEWSNSGDLYDGGAGVDTFSADVPVLTAYAQEIDLISGTNNWGDTFLNIENLIGGANNDKSYGTEGSNSFWGRAGNDLLDGRGGADMLYGEDGNDVLMGGAGNDMLDGGAGNDNLDGGSGDETINGGDGDDVVLGGAGIDTLNGDVGNDTMDGGADADRVTGGDGDDTVNGGDGNDALYGDAGTDSLSGGLGNDRITGGAGADVIVGNEGMDTADYRKSADGVTVSLVTGTGLYGDAQGDTLTTIENLSGSAFDDILTGDNGVNRLTGMSGKDYLYGMGGNDFIATGGGYDYVDGGAGIDTVTYENSWDRVVVNLATGISQYGEASRDVLVSIENIMASAFDDTITGDAGANRLNGMDGNDVISAGGGIDYVLGGGGDDTMTGGAAADVFVFDGVFGNDTIVDFWAGATRTDRIWLTNTGFDDYADVLVNAVDSAVGAVVHIADHGDITLAGVSVAQLNADDFIFG